jgi:hypothetical protein
MQKNLTMLSQALRNAIASTLVWFCLLLCYFEPWQWEYAQCSMQVRRGANAAAANGHRRGILVPFCQWP